MTKFGVIFSCLFLSACCCPQQDVLRRDAGPTFVETQLGQAAEIAHDNLAMLARLRGEGMYPLLPAPDPDLEQPVTIAWTGSVKGALEKICLSIRYQLRETGNIPAQPATVVIRGTDRKAYELLEDIAWQTHPRAALRVDAINRVVTLAYGS